ncbi:aminotransferase-like domain-containing protein [Aminipila terrae]|uniref:Aminotransferase class I/II-fold pyridoxal phosphate-dependent enzyme n=1 Tax=Aminipila terrae TaxID=2697030 RepID=A0A6P1MCI0_9FIRM|nr:PLP-dependent aminotransferase family protein [Aminipila terrae]QHI71722.1 aminotransferase class I/II-fold pyridoxal phosphate-dependent enzyme [Aminipila terrae]
MWNPKIIDTDKILYIAIADAIERDVTLGILKPNEKMPPQRALAKIIGVNLTTISRAYKEAEKRGLISGTIGSGTYVLQNEKKDITLPEILSGHDEIIELGLVGSMKVEGYDLSNLLKAIAEDNAFDSLLDYVPSQGVGRHREVASKWIRQYGLNVGCDRIVVCAGAMHAISCCLIGIFEPGDRIAVDSLTFTGIKNIAQLSHIKLEPIAMDSEGMIPESLENMCKKYQIKGIYLMPNMQNPTATVMSTERKQAIADIILRYGLILIEDDIYNFTNNTERTALSALVPDKGIFISGISKALLPGLRIAFVVVPEQFLHKFIHAVTSTVWMAPPISAELVTRFIENGTAVEIINKKRKVLARRLQLAKAILKDFSFQTTESSMFLWLDLPEGWSCTDFENIALMNKVRVISAYKFYVGNQLPPNAVRISLGAVKNDEQLVKGLNVLVRILKQYPLLTSPVM